MKKKSKHGVKVVALISKGEIVKTIKYIEQLDLENKIQVNEKFFLTILVLMELTILGSKEKPFRKEAINEILNFIDKELCDCVDYDLNLVYDEDGDSNILFAPSFLFFKMACEMAQMELDYKILYDWVDDNGFRNWISQMGPYTDFEFEVMLEIANYKNYGFEYMHQHILIELIKQDKFTEGFDIARKDWSYGPVDALIIIADGYTKLKKIEESNTLLLECLKHNESVSSQWTKVNNLRRIATLFWENGKEIEAYDLIQQSLLIIRNSNDEFLKTSGLGRISEDLIRLGKVIESDGLLKEALKNTDEITNKSTKVYRLKEIIAELAKQGKVNECLINIKKIPGKSEKSYAFLSLIIQLAKKGKISESLEIIKGKVISLNGLKSESLISIASELIKQSKYVEAHLLLIESQKYASKTINYFMKISCHVSIAQKLIDIGKVTEAEETIKKALMIIQRLLSIESTNEVEVCMFAFYKIEQVLCDLFMITGSLILLKKTMKILEKINCVDKYYIIRTLLDEFTKKDKLKESFALFQAYV
jgi:tetratricopeptide (TPR) repeat protein